MSSFFIINRVKKRKMFNLYEVYMVYIEKEMEIVV